jgi:hypothetical protein
MAPRAGFEVHRKSLSEQAVWLRDKVDTPTDTPRFSTLECALPPVLFALS